MVAARGEKNLAVVVHFPGEDAKTKDKVKQFGDKLGLKKVSLACTKDEAKMKVDPKADFTVMLYRMKKVVANFATDDQGLDSAKVAKIVAATKKMVADAEASKEKLKEKPKAKA